MIRVPPGVGKNIGRLVRRITPWEEPKEKIEKQEKKQQELISQQLKEATYTPAPTPDEPREEEVVPSPQVRPASEGVPHGPGFSEPIRRQVVNDFGPSQGILPRNPSEVSGMFTGSATPFTAIHEKLHQGLMNPGTVNNAVIENTEPDAYRDAIYDFGKMQSEVDYLGYEDKRVDTELNAINKLLETGEVRGEALTNLEKRRNALTAAIQERNIEGEIASHERRLPPFGGLLYAEKRAWRLANEKKARDEKMNITSQQRKHWYWTSFNMLGNYYKGTGSLLERNVNAGTDANGIDLLPEIAIQNQIMLNRGGITNQAITTGIFGDETQAGLVGGFMPQTGDFVMRPGILDAYFKLHGIEDSPQARQEAFGKLVAYMDVTYWLKSQYDESDIITYNEHWGRWDQENIGPMNEKDLAYHIVSEGWFKGVDVEDLRFYNVIKPGGLGGIWYDMRKNLAISSHNKNLEFEIDNLYAELKEMQSLASAGKVASLVPMPQVSRSRGGMPTGVSMGPGWFGEYTAEKEKRLNDYREKVIAKAEQLEMRKMEEPTDENGNPLKYFSLQGSLYHTANMFGFLRPHMEMGMSVAAGAGLAYKVRNAWLASQAMSGALWLPDPSDVVGLGATAVITALRISGTTASIYKQMKGMLYKEMTNVEIPFYYDTEGRKDELGELLYTPENQISKEEAIRRDIEPTMVRMSETILPSVVATVGAVGVTYLEAVFMKIYRGLFRGTAPSVRAKYFNPNGTPKKGLVSKYTLATIAWVAREGGYRRAMRLGSGQFVSIGMGSVIEGIEEMAEDMTQVIGREAANFENALANGAWGSEVQSLVKGINPHAYLRDVTPDGTIIGPWEGDVFKDVNFGSSFYHGFMMSLVSMGLGGIGAAPIRAYKDVKWSKEFKNNAMIRVATRGETEALIRRGVNLTSQERKIRGIDTEGVRVVYAPLDSLSIMQTPNAREVAHYENIIESAKTSDEALLEPVRVHYTNRESMNLAREIGGIKKRELEEERETKKEDAEELIRLEKILEKETTFVVDEKDTAYVQALINTGEWSEAPVSIENTMNTRILAETQEAVQENRDAVGAPDRVDLSKEMSNTARKNLEDEPSEEEQERSRKRKETVKKLTTGVFVSTDPNKPNLQVVPLRNPAKKRLDFLGRLRLNGHAIADYGSLLGQQIKNIRQSRKELKKSDELNNAESTLRNVLAFSQKYRGWIEEEIKRDVKTTAKERGIEVGQAWLEYQDKLQKEVSRLTTEVEAVFKSLADVTGNPEDLNVLLEAIQKELKSSVKYMEAGDELHGRELHEGEETGFGVIPYRLDEKGDIQLMSPGRYAFSDLHDVIDSISGIGLPDMPAIGDKDYRFFGSEEARQDIREGVDEERSEATVQAQVIQRHNQKMADIADLFEREALDFRDRTIRPQPLDDLGEVPTIRKVKSRTGASTKRGKNIIRVFFKEGTDDAITDVEEERYKDLKTLVEGWNSTKVLFHKETGQLGLKGTAYDPESRIENEPKIGEWATESDHKGNDLMYQLSKVIAMEVNLKDEEITDSFEGVTPDDLELIRQPNDIKPKEGDKPGIVALKRKLMNNIRIIQLLEAKVITALPPIRISMVDGSLEFVSGDPLLLKAAQLWYGSDLRRQQGIPIWVNPEHPYESSSLDYNTVAQFNLNKKGNSPTRGLSPTAQSMTKGRFSIANTNDGQFNKFVQFLVSYRHFYQRTKDDDGRLLYNFSGDFWRLISAVADQNQNVTDSLKLSLINEMNKPHDADHPGPGAYRDGWNSIEEMGESYMDEYHRRLLAHQEVRRIEDLESPRNVDPRSEEERARKIKRIESTTVVGFVSGKRRPDDQLGAVLVKGYDETKADALWRRTVFWLLESDDVTDLSRLDNKVALPENITELGKLNKLLEWLKEKKQTEIKPVTDKLPVMKEVRFSVNNPVYLSGMLNVGTRSDNFLSARVLMSKLSNNPEVVKALKGRAKVTQSGLRLNMTVWDYLNQWVGAHAWDDWKSSISEKARQARFKRVQREAFEQIFNELKEIGYDGIVFDGGKKVEVEVVESERPIKRDENGTVENIDNPAYKDYIHERTDFLQRLTRVIGKGIKNLHAHTTPEATKKHLNNLVNPEKEIQDQPVEVINVAETASWVKPNLTEEEIGQLALDKNRIGKIPETLDLLRKQALVLSQNIPVLEGETGKSKSQENVESLLKDNIQRYQPFKSEKEGGIPIKEAKAEAKALNYPGATKTIYSDQGLNYDQKVKLLAEKEALLAAYLKEYNYKEKAEAAEHGSKEVAKLLREARLEKESDPAVIYKITLDHFPKIKRLHVESVQLSKTLNSMEQEISQLKYDIEHATEPFFDLDATTKEGKLVGFTQKLHSRPKIHGDTKEEALAKIKRIRNEKKFSSYKNYKLDVREVIEREVSYVDNPNYKSTIINAYEPEVFLEREGAEPLLVYEEQIDERKKLPTGGSQEVSRGWQIIATREAAGRPDNRAWLKKYIEWKNKRAIVSLSSESTAKERNKANVQRIFCKEIVDELVQLDKVAQNYLDGTGQGKMYQGQRLNAGGHALGWKGQSAQGDQIEFIGEAVKQMTNSLKRWLLVNMKQSDLFGLTGDRAKAVRAGRYIRIRKALESEGMTEVTSADIARRALEIEAPKKKITKEMVQRKAKSVMTQLQVKGDPFLYNFSQNITIPGEEDLGKVSEGYVDFWNEYTKKTQEFIKALERIHSSTGRTDAEIDLQREQKDFKSELAQNKKAIEEAISIKKEGKKWRVDLKEGWVLPDEIIKHGKGIPELRHKIQVVNRDVFKKTYVGEFKDKIKYVKTRTVSKAHKYTVLPTTYFFDQRPDRALVDLVERGKENTDSKGDPVIKKENIKENIKKTFVEQARALKGDAGKKELAADIKSAGGTGFSKLKMQALRDMWVDMKMKDLPHDYENKVEEHVKESSSSRERFITLVQIAEANRIPTERLVHLWNNLHGRRHTVSEEERLAIAKEREAEFRATETVFRTDKPMEPFDPWGFETEGFEDKPIETSSEDILKNYDPSIPMDEFVQEAPYRMVENAREVRGSGGEDKSIIRLSDQQEFDIDPNLTIALRVNLPDVHLPMTSEGARPPEDVGSTGAYKEAPDEEYGPGERDSLLDLGIGPDVTEEGEQFSALDKAREEGGAYTLAGIREDIVERQYRQKAEAFSGIGDPILDDDLKAFLMEVDNITLQSMIYEYRNQQTDMERESWSKNFENLDYQGKIAFARKRRFASPWSVAFRQLLDRTRGNGRRYSKKGPNWKEQLKSGARGIADLSANVTEMEKNIQTKREVDAEIGKLESEQENVEQRLARLEARSVEDLPPRTAIAKPLEETTHIEMIEMAESALDEVVANLPQHDVTVNILQKALAGEEVTEGLLQEYLDDGLQEGAIDQLHMVGGSMKKLLLMFKQFNIGQEAVKSIEDLVQSLERIFSQEESLRALFQKFKTQQEADVKRKKKEMESRRNQDAIVKEIVNATTTTIIALEPENVIDTADVDPLTDVFSRHSPTLANASTRHSDPQTSQIWSDISGKYTLEEIGRLLNKYKVSYNFGDKNWNTVGPSEVIQADKNNIELEPEGRPSKVVQDGMGINNLTNLNLRNADSDIRIRRQEVDARNALARVQREYWKKVNEIATDRGNNMMGFYWEAVQHLQAGIDINFFKNYRSGRTAGHNDRAGRFMNRNFQNEQTPKRMLNKLSEKPLQEWTMLELEELNRLINDLTEKGQATYEAFQKQRQEIMRLQTKAMIDNFDKYTKSRGADPTSDEFGPVGSIKRGEGGIPRRMIDNSAISRALLMRWTNLRPTRWADKLDGDKHYKVWGSGDATFDGPAYNLFVDEPREAQQRFLKGVRKRQDVVVAIMTELGIGNTELLNGLAPKTTLLNDDGKELDLTNDDAMAVYALNKVEYGRVALRLGKSMSESLQEEIIDLLPEKFKTLADIIIEDYTETVPRLNEARLLNEGEGFIARPEYHIPIFKYAKMEVAGQVSPDLTNTMISQQVFSVGDASYGFLKSYMDNPSNKEAENMAKLEAEPRLGFATTWFGMVEHQERYIHMWSIWAKLKAIFENDTGVDVFQTRLRQAHGSHAVQIVKRFIERVGRGGYKPIENEDAYAKMFRTLRQHLGFTVLAGNLSTAIKQGPSLGFFLGEAKPKNLISALQNLVDPDNARQVWSFVREHDEMIRERNVSRDLDELRTGNPILYKRLQRKIGKVGMSMIYGIDASVVTAGAIAVYDYHFNDLGESHEEAVRAMSGAIVRTQPASHIFDVAERYDTNNEFLRTILLFSNQLSNIWNMATYDMPKRAFTGSRTFNERIRGAGGTFIGLGASMMLMYMMAYRRVPEDEDDWKEFLLMSVLTPMPVTGRIMLNARANFTPIETSANEMIETAFRVLKNPTLIGREAGIRDYAYMAGLLSGMVPAELISRIGDVYFQGDPLRLIFGTQRELN